MPALVAGNCVNGQPLPCCGLLPVRASAAVATGADSLFSGQHRQPPAARSTMLHPQHFQALTLQQHVGLALRILW